MHCSAQCCTSGSGLKKGMAGNPTVFPHPTSPCSLIHDEGNDDDDDYDDDDDRGQDDDDDDDDDDAYDYELHW